MGRPRTNEATVALFPFLAVLLCTMGSLILMLVVITRSQAERARKEAAAPPNVAVVDTTVRDELDWEIEQLSKSRDKTAEQLAERRAALAHLEEHAQRLRSELAELETAERAFFDRKSLDEAAKAALRNELQELLKKIAETEAKLAEAKAKGKRPPNFSIVPYDGESGTRRRPIYIECRGDAIVLQPEGTTFTEGDFIGPLGASNPLAVCIRVVAEHYARTGALQAGEQPYPLLLVRPSGITTYYCAIAALRSWDSDFGYELIDENWPLEFPPADPQLAQTLARAQDAARQRQLMIARAAPSLNQGAPPSFRGPLPGNELGTLSGDGSSGPTGSGGSRRYIRPNDAPPPRSPTTASGYGAVGNGPGGNGAKPNGLAGNGPSETGLPGATASGSGANDLGPQLGSPSAGLPTSGNAANGMSPIGEVPTGGVPNGAMPGVPMPGGDGLTVAPVGSMPNGSTSSGAMPNGPTGFGEVPMSGTPAASSGGEPGPGGIDANGTLPTTGTPSLVGPRYAQNVAGNSGSGSDSYTGGNATAGSNTPGGSSSGSGGGPTSGAAAQGATASSAASGGPAMGGTPGGMPSMQSTVGDAPPPEPQLPGNFQDRPPSNLTSLAQDRGRNWGLPEQARRATGVTRPVQILCSRDRLTVLSDRGTPDKQIDMPGPTVEVVDDLVSTVWGQVEDWGIAGRGMYWKPTLSMHVAPDGVERYRELQALLAESGLDLTGKEITVNSKSSKPVRRGY